MQIQHTFLIINQHVTIQFYITDVGKLVINSRSYLFNLFLSLKTPKTMVNDHLTKNAFEASIT